MGKETYATDRRPKGRYNGHPSWNFWNVSVWLSYPEDRYYHVMALCQRHGKDRAANLLFEELGGTNTPDGAPFTRSSIRHGLRHL